jgi:hypothetical protein
VFATVLKEITGYFDRRNLLSAFLPTLAALAAVAIGLVLSTRGVRGAARLWTSLPGSVQVVVIVGFLGLVTLWTFVLINLRPLMDQSFQGRWGESGLLGALARRRAARFRAERGAAIEADERLEVIEAALVQATAALPRPGQPGRPFDGDPAAELQAVEQAWASAATLPLEDAAAALPLLSDRLSALAATGAPALDDPRFACLAAAAARLTERRLQDVRARRASVQQRLFVLYPDEPVDVAPTKIGNILLAAEQHPRLRYGLDPVVIWSRLQPLLPEALAGALKDAKASLDMMLTLSAYLLAAGVPLVILAAVTAPLHGSPLPWASVIAAVITIIGLLRLGQPRATLAVALTFLPVAAISASLDAAPAGAAAVIMRVALGIILTAAVITLSVTVHAAACEAALAFSDQLKSAFDLYRQLVIRDLGLEFPVDLAAERALWLDICQFLYRGDYPVSAEFRYRPAPSS